MSKKIKKPRKFKTNAEREGLTRFLNSLMTLVKHMPAKIETIRTSTNTSHIVHVSEPFNRFNQSEVAVK